MRKLVLGCCLCALSGAVFAGATRSWKHASQGDFEKGVIRGLTLRSDGHLSLAPTFSELYDASASYLWAAAEDSKGNLYAAGSANDGKVAIHIVDPAGKGRVFTELAGLAVYALAVDSQDRLYAATSPDGKIYRVAPGASPETFYDPKAKYIWALAFLPGGDLLAATGDKGQLHRVNPNGAGTVLFTADDANIRSLAAGRDGVIFAGTEPSGQILRISTAGEGFVVYQSPKREITALALDAHGSLYAAAVGNKQAGSPAPAPAPPPAPPPSPVQSAAGGAISIGTRASVPPAQPPLSMGPTAAGGSEVIRVEADGYPRKVWSSSSELAYTIAFDRDGRLLIGTGNKGGIYRVENGPLWSWVLSAKPTQITALTSGRGGRIYALTGNIGKIYQLGPETEQQGAIESDVLDASFFAYWGRIRVEGTLHGGSVKLETRSGNLDTPQRHWSGWMEVPMTGDAGRVPSPSARFLQYRLTLRRGAGAPEIASVSIAYQPKNVAPIIEIVETTPPNYRFPPQSLTLTPSRNITLHALGRPSRPSTVLSSGSASTSMNYAKGYVGVRWLARDENDDPLIFRIEIRGVRETTWRLLKDGVKDDGYSWDAAALADGAYVLRVTASDAPGNPPAQALTASLESEPFVIDNTPPSISALAASRRGNRIELKWRATDALNVVQEAEYSVDGGDWVRAEPTTRLADSLEHDYVLLLDDPGPGEHTYAVRVRDEFDNQSVEKTVLR